MAYKENSVIKGVKLAVSTGGGAAGNGDPSTGGELTGVRHNQKIRLNKTVYKEGPNHGPNSDRRVKENNTDQPRNPDGSFAENSLIGKPVEYEKRGKGTGQIITALFESLTKNRDYAILVKPKIKGIDASGVPIYGNEQVKLNNPKEIYDFLNSKWGQIVANKVEREESTYNYENDEDYSLKKGNVKRDAEGKQVYSKTVFTPQDGDTPAQIAMKKVLRIASSTNKSILARDTNREKLTALLGENLNNIMRGGPGKGSPDFYHLVEKGKYKTIFNNIKTKSQVDNKTVSRLLKGIDDSSLLGKGTTAAIAPVTTAAQKEKSGATNIAVGSAGGAGAVTPIDGAAGTSTKVASGAIDITKGSADTTPTSLATGNANDVAKSVAKAKSLTTNVETNNKFKDYMANLDLSNIQKLSETEKNRAKRVSNAKIQERLLGGTDTGVATSSGEMAGAPTPSGVGTTLSGAYRDIDAEKPGRTTYEIVNDFKKSDPQFANMSNSDVLKEIRKDPKLITKANDFIEEHNYKIIHGGSTEGFVSSSQKAAAAEATAPTTAPTGTPTPVGVSTPSIYATATPEENKQTILDLRAKEATTAAQAKTEKQFMPTQREGKYAAEFYQDKDKPQDNFDVATPLGKEFYDTVIMGTDLFKNAKNFPTDKLKNSKGIRDMFNYWKNHRQSFETMLSDKEGRRGFIAYFNRKNARKQ